MRRSTRRRRTVSAFRENGRLVVLLPAALSAEEEAVWVARMVERLEAKERRHASDAWLEARARQLAAEYLDPSVRPASVRWVANQNTRWGSCTSSTGEIRLSDRLQGMPDWVVDAVLLHELAHLVHADHSAAFWALMSRYPRYERARGFLDGVLYGQGLPVRGDDPAILGVPDC